MGVLQGPVGGDFRERNPVPVDWDDLRRRRPDNIQPAEPGQPHSDSRGPGTRNQPDLYPRQTLGVEQVTLTTAQIPSHTHTLSGSSDIATNPGPGGNILATSSLLQPYVGIAPDANMAANAIAPSGGSTPHDNMMPFLCISFIIALSGIFPSQS